MLVGGVRRREGEGASTGGLDSSGSLARALVLVFLDFSCSLLSSSSSSSFSCGPNHSCPQCSSPLHLPPPLLRPLCLVNPSPLLPSIKFFPPCPFSTVTRCVSPPLVSFSMKFRDQCAACRVNPLDVSVFSLINSPPPTPFALNLDVCTSPWLWLYVALPCALCNVMSSASLTPSMNTVSALCSTSLWISCPVSSMLRFQHFCPLGGECLNLTYVM